MNKRTDLTKLLDRELLMLYSALLDELRARDLTRTNNNPVADYAEKTVIERLKLKRVHKEAKGYDAIDSKDKKYQIKGRRITKHNQSRQLGVIRNLEDNLFDFLIAVVFDEDFNPREIWQIPHLVIKHYSKWSKQQNGHILHLRGNILLDPRVIRIL